MASVLTGQYGAEAVLSSVGALLPNTAITVLNMDGTNAMLYTSLTSGTGGTSSPYNPVSTDALGNLLFYAVPGQYQLKIGGLIVATITVDLPVAALLGSRAVDPVIGYGADPLGLSDSAPAFRNAVAAAAATSPLTGIGIPPGTYLMSTVDSNGIFCALPSGVTIFPLVPGTVTIRVASGAPNWWSVFGTPANSTIDLSGLYVAPGITFDGNSSGNPITSGNVSTLASFPRYCISGYKGDNLKVMGCTFQNWDCENIIILEGQINGMSNLVLAHNLVENTGSNAQYHDHSSFYSDSAGVSVHHNRFLSFSGNVNAVCAMELHGSAIHEHDNESYYYATGVRLVTQVSYSSTIGAASNGLALPQSTVALQSIPAGLPTSGSVIISGINTVVAYGGISANNLTGCTGGTGTLLTGQKVYANTGPVGTGTNGYISHDGIWQHCAYAINPIGLLDMSGVDIHDHIITVDIDQWPTMTHQGIDAEMFQALKGFHCHDLDITFLHRTGTGLAGDNGITLFHPWTADSDDEDIEIDRIRIKDPPGAGIEYSCLNSVHRLHINDITGHNVGGKGTNVQLESLVYTNVTGTLYDGQFDRLALIDEQVAHTCSGILYVTGATMTNCRMLDYNQRLADGATVPTYTLPGGQTIYAPPQIAVPDPPTGYTAETFQRASGYMVAQSLAGSGEQVGTAVWLNGGQTVSKVGFIWASAGSGQTHLFYALYSPSDALIGATADQGSTPPTVGTSVAAAQYALATNAAGGAMSSYTAPSSGWYYITITQVATTMGTVYGSSNEAAAFVPVMAWADGIHTGLTTPSTLPATAGLSGLARMFYGGVG
jgi:hypothetical protein